MIGSSRLEVDHLARAAVRLALVERHRDRRRRGDAADRVGEAERRQGRRAVGLAGQVGEAAHRLGEGAEAGARGVRPGLAEPGDPGDDQTGVELVQRRRGRGPSARGCRAGSSRPARRRCATRRRKTSAPSAADRLSADGALVARDLRPPDRGAVERGPWPRMPSPARGCSILITSAPKSPRIWQARGPARIVEASTTRMPVSGPSEVVIAADHI